MVGEGVPGPRTVTTGTVTSGSGRAHLKPADHESRAGMQERGRPGSRPGGPIGGQTREDPTLVGTSPSRGVGLITHPPAELQGGEMASTD